MFDFLNKATNEELVVIVSTPIYAIFIIGEILLSNFQNRGYYSLKDTLYNLYFMILNAGLDLITRAITWGVLLYFYQFHFFEIQTPWIYWLALFLLEDFAYFWLHYFDHFIRFFWAVHITHHSSEKFNFTIGFRSSVFQPLYRFVYFIPLVLIGFRVADLALMFAITQIYGILVHTNYIPKLKNTALGWIENILVTPSHHRVHHGSNIEYLDKNMGMCLIIWDKMFGTFQEEIDDLPIHYGLVSQIPNPNPVNSIFYEWNKIYKDFNKNLPLSTRLNYVFKPPGWSHDSSTLTSEQLRQVTKMKH